MSQIGRASAIALRQDIRMQTSTTLESRKLSFVLPSWQKGSCSMTQLFFSSRDVEKLCDFTGTILFSLRTLSSCPHICNYHETTDFPGGSEAKSRWVHATVRFNCLFHLVYSDALKAISKQQKKRLVRRCFAQTTTKVQNTCVAHDLFAANRNTKARISCVHSCNTNEIYHKQVIAEKS